jgi:hypothetical protein
MASSAKLRRFLASIKPSKIVFCSRRSNRYSKKSGKFKNQHHFRRQYGSSHRKTVKLQHMPTVYGYNHVAKRLQDRREDSQWLNTNGTLRQVLASSNIYQQPRLKQKFEDILQRVQQADHNWQGTEQAREQFKLEFKTWMKSGQPETRDNYFWRIKYCGLIELGIEYHYLKPLYKMQQMRRDRGLRSALDLE